MCSEVSYYHSAKSISGSKKLMYSTVALRNFKIKVDNRKRWIKFIRVLLKRKSAIQVNLTALIQQPKKKNKRKIVELNT